LASNATPQTTSVSKAEPKASRAAFLTNSRLTVPYSGPTSTAPRRSFAPSW